MSDAFVAVDWGTTNRRVFRIGGDGRMIDRRVDDKGVLSIADFPAEVVALQTLASGAPLLLAGMVGSNRGWIEIPYVTAPAGLDDVATGVVWPMPRAAIVPGVQVDDAVRPDVMRGEEVQLLGALAIGRQGNAGFVGDGLYCHPGTHTKWIDVEAGQIMRFRTVMTGDIFAALQAKSILSDLLAHDAGEDSAFLDGVAHGHEVPDLTGELFSVRARVVTGRMTAADAASRISGLLIGTDLRIGLGRGRADVVTLVGAPALCRRYALALAGVGREAVIVDGEAAFVAGAHAIMARMT